MTIDNGKRLSMDARLKLPLLALALALVLTHPGCWFSASVTAASVIALVYLSVPARTLLIRFMEPMMIILVIIALKSFSGGGDALKFNLFGAEAYIYRDGLLEGLKIGLRILAAIGAVSVMGFSTPFPEFLSALSFYRVPAPLIEISLFAHRYLSGFMDEARTIYSSQRNRLGYAGLKNSFNSFGILAGSLTLRAFEQAESAGEALHQRGYDGTIPLNNRKVFVAAEVAASLFIVLAMGLIWLMT